MWVRFWRKERSKMWYFDIGLFLALFMFILSNIVYFADESIERSAYPFTFVLAILAFIGWGPILVVSVIVGPCWLIAQPIKKYFFKDKIEHV